MKFDATGRRSARLGRQIAALLFSLAMVGCATQPAVPGQQRFEDSGVETVLNYYQMLTRMTTAELGRERRALAALPGNANTRIRTAMLLGLTRSPQDLGRAITLLEAVTKSTDPASIRLQPLARLLTDNYTERQSLDAQTERLTVQAQDDQRKAIELQEKIDRLTEIERTLPSLSIKPSESGGAR